MFYRAPNKAVCADVIPFYDTGEFKLFYLKDYRNIPQDGEGCPWHLLTTRDLMHYEDHGIVIPRGTAEEQDLHVFTGCCVKIGKKFVIYYTGHNPHLRQQGLPEQKILRATSDDLLHWEKDREFVFEAPEQFEMHDFRDPFVFYDEEGKRYGMLIAGRVKNDGPVFSKGVTLIAYSKDGMTGWKVEDEPFYAPHAYFTHECPDLFRMGDWWYLVFSEFTDRVITTYRMSKSLRGPWLSPKVNSFDGHAFYAAKSAFDGKRRVMFGWNCIRYGEKDDGFWQWGGSVVPHELVQGEDGTLYVRCPDEVAAAGKPLPLEEAGKLGLAERTAGGYRIGDEGKSFVLFKAPRHFKFELDITPHDDRGDFGIILRESGNMGRFYSVRFDPLFNRMAMDRYPRVAGRGYVDPDTERYCPMEAGKAHKVLVIAEDSVLEVFVDGKYAMSERIFDFTEGNIGIYTHNTCVDFTKLGLAEREEVNEG